MASVNCVNHGCGYFYGMPTEPRRRKRALSLYLREDIVEALERVSADSDLSVSKVAEIVLGFHLELNGLVEKGRFLIEVNRRFRTTA